jgi:hypothetical protein
MANVRRRQKRKLKVTMPTTETSGGRDPTGYEQNDQKQGEGNSGVNVSLKSFNIQCAAIPGAAPYPGRTAHAFFTSDRTRSVFVRFSIQV